MSVLDEFLRKTEINSIKVDYLLPNGSRQTLIDLNQQESLNGGLTYRITPDFNFPTFVENLQLEYGTLPFATQQFVEQTYLPLLGGSINGNLTIRGLLNAYGITIDNVVGKSWTINLGVEAAPLIFSRSNVAIYEIPYKNDGDFYFRDFINPANHYITINPTYKKIGITYGDVEIANSNQWSAGYTSVVSNSANWNTAYSTVYDLSGNWGRPTVSVYTPVGGSTVSFNTLSQDETMFLDLGAPITGLTIEFPPNANSAIGQTIRIFANQDVNATVSYTNGIRTPTGAPSLSANVGYTWQKVKSNYWIQIS